MDISVQFMWHSVLFVLLYKAWDELSLPKVTLIVQSVDSISAVGLANEVFFISMFIANSREYFTLSDVCLHVPQKINLMVCTTEDCKMQ